MKILRVILFIPALAIVSYAGVLMAVSHLAKDAFHAVKHEVKDAGHAVKHAAGDVKRVAK